MPREFRFTDPGEGIHEGEIVDVLVSTGDEVEEDQTVLVVETDKATTELPSPYSGTVAEVRVEEGDLVEVGDVLMTFSGNGEVAAEPAEAEPAEEEAEEEEPAAAEEEGGRAAAVGELPTEERPPRPEARRGPGRPPAPARAEAEGRVDGGPVPASPATRRLARELGVDLRTVEASGPHGRVTAEDVRAAGEAPAEERPAGAPERRGPTVETPPLPDFERWGPVERTPAARGAAQHRAACRHVLAADPPCDPP